jgi:mono/diheme cytochrome c family protein/plastocyanin
MRRIPALVLAILLLGLPAAVVISQGQPQASAFAVITARMAEAGGWSPDELRVQVGQPLTLRVTSADVVHGFAIARSGLDPVDVEPGRWAQLTWTPKVPGEYTFYCTRWCGPNHWRMTGILFVEDPTGSLPTPTEAPPPLFQQLGLDLDQREELPALRRMRPSAASGAALGIAPRPASLGEIDMTTTRPIEVWRVLRADPAARGLSDESVWDLVAASWIEGLDPMRVQAGETIYQRKCAACHGPTGAGDGIMARHFDDPQVADFTDLARMATANSAILQGKILRGGMGTGMPYWGAILTEEETWAATEYVWWLAFSGR